MSAAGVFAAITLLALAALLWAEFRDARRVAWVSKPLASTAFLAAALAWGAWQTSYGRIVLLALGLCWIGDVLLIPRGARGAFLAGLVSFLLGHIAFAAAFLSASFAPGMAGAAVLGVAPAAALALLWLWPHVEGGMRGPVLAYILVISAMVLCAAGAAAGAGRPAIAIGAVCFFLSDLAVARERFVASTPWNPAWGLPLYYGAQLILASTVA